MDSANQRQARRTPADQSCSHRHGVSLLYTSFSDPNGLVPLVKEMEWLDVAIERTPTPTCSSRG